MSSSPAFTAKTRRRKESPSFWLRLYRKAAVVYGLDDFFDRLLFYENVPYRHLVDDLPDDLRGGDLLAVVVDSTGKFIQMLPPNPVSAPESLAQLQPVMTVVQVNEDLIEAAQTL